MFSFRMKSVPVPKKQVQKKGSERFSMRKLMLSGLGKCGACGAK